MSDTMVDIGDTPAAKSAAVALHSWQFILVQQYNHLDNAIQID